MKVSDILAMGTRNLLRRKTRTVLTVMGVVVGATAIVIMLSLGIGMNETLNQTIANMGDLTLIELRNYATIKDADGNWTSAENKLDEALIEQIKQMDEVLAVTPYINLYNDFAIHAGRKYESQRSEIYGIDPLFLPYLNIEVERGDTPVASDNSFILISSDSLVYFRDPNRPIRDWYREFYNSDGTKKPPKIDILSQNIYIQGRTYTWDSSGNYVENQSFRFKKYTFDKIGIMTTNEKNWETYSTYVDIETAKALQAEIEKAKKVSKANSQVGKYNWVKIKVKDIKAAETLQQKLTDMGVTASYNLADIRDELQSQQATTQFVLGCIGAMSLLVAAIGIANTMFMSIYERTKEIGVMKVLGCPLSGIRSMFLFEASIIGFMGGLLGVGVSMIGSYAINNVPIVSQALRNMSGTNVYSYYADNSGDISIIPLWLISLAVLFSTLIGLVSGYLPARHATKISALEAIRNE